MVADYVDKQVKFYKNLDFKLIEFGLNGDKIFIPLTIGVH